MMTTEQAISLVLVVGGLAVVVGFLIRMIIEDTHEKQIKKLIKFGVQEFLTQEIKSITPKQLNEEEIRMKNIAIPCVEKPKSDEMYEPPLETEAFKTLQEAMKNQKPPTEEASLEEIISTYDPKMVRSALCKLQTRVGGKFVKEG